MKITKIEIENFKSIKEIDFDIKKFGASYTTMLLGINESGKSNVLQAMSFFDTPKGEFDYDLYHNQKDEENNPIDLWFHLAFHNKNVCADELKKNIENGDLLDFRVTNIIKNVYLERGETVFSESYHFEITNLTKNLFFKKGTKTITNAAGQPENVEIFEIKDIEEEGYQLLDAEVIKEYFSNDIKKIIKRYEPKTIFWKPSEEYLISTEDLVKFSSEPSSRPALKNIFLLAGYDDDDLIKNVVSNVANGQARSRLTSKLQEGLDKYIKTVWKHDIDVVIDITETGKFTLSIKDSGEDNKHDRLPIDGRSEGAKHFLSLILSLSIENNHRRMTNQLILIDEPEAHLHPSGIRDLSKELLKIGNNNWLFVSTHSPFLIDKVQRERNIIIKKNEFALTEKTHIDKYTSVIDDEVLREAFGLEVFRDLLNPHSILVEGWSDKEILKKVFAIKGHSNYGITNGHGSNIDTLAAKLNDSDISIMVILDDDKNGKSYKSKILKMRGSYSPDNVLTIRDLIGGIEDGGTIEDALDKEYVKSQFQTLYKEYYNTSNFDFELQEAGPILNQIKIFLHQNKKENIEDFLDNLKVELAQNFNVNKSSLKNKNGLLDSLAETIITKLSRS